METKDADYQIILKLVAHIDEDLTRDVCHYRNGSGLLLTTLDEVVRAMLIDDLTIGEATKVGPMTTKDHERIQQVLNLDNGQRQKRRRQQRKVNGQRKERVMINPDATYKFIADFVASNTYGPTTKEIAIGANVSISTVFDQLDLLEAWGWIMVSRGPGGYRRSRTIRAVR